MREVEDEQRRDLTFVPFVSLSNRSHSNEANARSSAYEAISTSVTQSAADTLSTVSQVTLEVLSRMENLMTVQVRLLSSLLSSRSTGSDLLHLFPSLYRTSSLDPTTETTGTISRVTSVLSSP